MSKHTKGPWHVEMLPICQKGGECGDAAYRLNHDEGQFPMLDEVDGNCRLIAAAPELLEELKSILHVTMFGGGLTPDELMNRCAKAIAKAEGENK